MSRATSAARQDRAIVAGSGDAERAGAQPVRHHPAGERQAADERAPKEQAARMACPAGMGEEPRDRVGMGREAVSRPINRVT
jgi:hypothetical protein